MLLTLIVVSFTLIAIVCSLNDRAMIPASFLFTAFLGVALACGTYGPTEDPSKMEARAHAWQLAGMWGSRLADSLDCQDHPIPMARPVHVGEDVASEQQEKWAAYAKSIDVR